MTLFLHIPVLHISGWTIKFHQPGHLWLCPRYVPHECWPHPSTGRDAPVFVPLGQRLDPDIMRWQPSLNCKNQSKAPRKPVVNRWSSPRCMYLEQLEFGVWFELGGLLLTHLENNPSLNFHSIIQVNSIINGWFGAPWYFPQLGILSFWVPTRAIPSRTWNLPLAYGKKKRKTKTSRSRNNPWNLKPIIIILMFWERG